MAIKLQTDGYLVFGILPNDEHDQCLICGEIPDFVHIDIFTPEPRDIPTCISSRIGEKTFGIKYRLCPRCFKAKPRPSKIRRFLLEGIKAMVVGL